MQSFSRHCLSRFIHLQVFWILLLSFCMQGYAQPEALFRWSSFQRVPKYSQAEHLFVTKQGYGDVIKFGVRNKLHLRVNLYSKELKLLDSKTISLLKIKEELLDIQTQGSHLYFLTQVDLPNQRVGVRLRKICADSLHAPTKPIDLIRVNETRFNRNISFHLTRRDHSLLIWYPNPPESDEAFKSVTVLTYDLNMNLTDRAVIDLAVKDELCELIKLEPLGEGNFLLYTKEYAVRPKEKRGFVTNYKFVFYYSKPDSSYIKSCTFKNLNLLPERGRMRWSQGKLEAMGFLTEKEDGPRLGYWYLHYDFVHLKLLLDTLYFFDEQVKSLPDNGFKSSLFHRSNLDYFYLDHFIRKDSKNRIAVAEQFLIIPASFGSTYTYNRFYGDLLLLYLNENGQVYQAQRVLKSQQTFNNFGEFSSYYVERKDTALHFFFNDHGANTGQDGRPQQLVWHKHSSLVLVKVSPDKIEKQKLANYKDLQAIIQVRDMLKLDDEGFLLYAYKKKRGKLGIMTLPTN